VLGDLSGADAELRKLIADADAAGDPLCRFNGLMTRSFVLGWQGKTTAALAAAETAIESAAELGMVRHTWPRATLRPPRTPSRRAIAAYRTSRLRRPTCYGDPKPSSQQAMSSQPGTRPIKPCRQPQDYFG
jgi:hypothetical protein